jgi:WbqC-like protein family
VSELSHPARVVRDPEPWRGTRVSVHQPNFLPWTKLFDKVLASDIYIAYDSVQYTRSEFHSRQRIAARDGAVWLSVPVLTRGRGRQPLCTVEMVEDRGWRGAHVRLLTEHYRRAPYFRELMDVLDSVYAGDDRLLVDFNLRLLRALLDYVGATVRVARATWYDHSGDNTERIIQLTRAVAGDVHLTSTYGTPRRYVDWSKVAAAGITVDAQQFSEPRYRQQVEPFRPDLSVVDLLFALGPAASGLLSARRQVDRVLAGGAAQQTRVPASS